MSSAPESEELLITGFKFLTSSNGTLAERLRISSDGNVTVNHDLIVSGVDHPMTQNFKFFVSIVKILVNMGFVLPIVTGWNSPANKLGHSTLLCVCKQGVIYMDPMGGNDTDIPFGVAEDIQCCILDLEYSGNWFAISLSSRRLFSGDTLNL